VPAALGGIVTGALLAMARAAGETARLLLTRSATTSCRRIPCSRWARWRSPIFRNALVPYPNCRTGLAHRAAARDLWLPPPNILARHIRPADPTLVAVSGEWWLGKRCRLRLPASGARFRHRDPLDARKVNFFYGDFQALQNASYPSRRARSRPDRTLRLWARRPSCGCSTGMYDLCRHAVRPARC